MSAKILSLNTKFQVPILAGILLGMILTIVIMSNEVRILSSHFTELAKSKLDHEHKELEETITESLHLKGVALGSFMAKTSVDYILSHDLEGLHKLEKEAQKDVDVISAIFLKPNKTPFLHSKRSIQSDIHQDEFTIKYANETLGYVSIALSRDLIHKKKMLATDYNAEMVTSIQNTTENSINQYITKSITYILLLAIIMNIFIYIVFNKLITIPIHKLSLSASEIGRGKLDSKVDLKLNDEIGQLGTTLNAMSSSLKESYDKLYKTNNELIEATIAKDQFLANMTHELRTPLNAVIGLSDLLKLDVDDPEACEKISLINESGKNLLAIIERILEITYIQSGKVDLMPVDFQIDVIINEIHTFIEQSLSTSGNIFTVSVDDSISDVNSDPLKIKEILINLICNADKFTRNGKIVLSIKRVIKDGIDLIVFKITDTGIGIPPETVNRIFDPFYQADASITRRHGGAGLGLAISKKYCHALGGDISVISRENIGTEFTVILPIDLSKHNHLNTNILLTG